MSETTQVADREAHAAADRASQEATRKVTITPAVDIVEDSQAVTLLADLPGVSRDKLDIRVHDDSLTIEAESVVATPANVRPAYAEARRFNYARRFVVSKDFDTSRVEANLKDGVLQLRIPRREESKPRRVEVRIS